MKSRLKKLEHELHLPALFAEYQKTFYQPITPAKIKRRSEILAGMTDEEFDAFVRMEKSLYSPEIFALADEMLKNPDELEKRFASEAGLSLEEYRTLEDEAIFKATGKTYKEMYPNSVFRRDEHEH